MPEFEPPAFAPTPNARVSIVKIHVPCNWAQMLEGQIDSAHSSSLHSSDMVPANVDSAKATDTTWLRPSTDKAPRMQCAEHQLRLPLRRDPQADPQCGYPRLRAHHGLYRAVHLPDSAQQRLQRRERDRAGGRSQHGVLFPRVDRRHARPASIRTRGASSTARSPASISRATFTTCATATTITDRTARR